MICTRCDGSGFLNLHQVPDDVVYRFDQTRDHQIILDWIESSKDHDVTKCDCCGDTKEWYGIPGEHDYKDYGACGPYAYNGGVPECS